MTRRSSRVLLLHTGGTIGMEMKSIGKGGAARLSSTLLGERLRKRVPELAELARCEIEVMANRDSAHLGPDDWLYFAERIQSRWSAYEGIVVLHGTDTMAYTASALSFLLRPCRKPVIFTGAQRPLAAIRTDARRNLISSVEIAAHGPRDIVSQICVFFDDELFQGNQVRKRSASQFAAFESPRTEPLARVGTEIQYRAAASSVRRAAKGAPRMRAAFSRRVAMVHVTPSAPYAAFAERILPELDGLCLIVYPSGTAPTHDGNFGGLLRRARRHEVPVVVIAEGVGAPPFPGAYAAGEDLQNAGCFWAGEMTPECAFTKASFILGQPDGRRRFASYWAQSFAGER